MPTLRTTTFVGALFASTALAQAPCFDLNIGTDLALFDDSCSAALPLGFTFTYNGVGYTTVSVCSNGYLWLGSGTLADYTPTQAELLSGAPRICPLWMDLNPGATGSGHVYANNPSPTTFTATWNNVFTFGTTSPHSMQITLDSSNGVTVTYGVLGPVAGTQSNISIIGASPGGGAVANNVSLAVRPVTIAGTSNWADVLPTPSGTPIPYGNTKMNWAATNPGYVISDVTCTPNSLPGPALVDVLGVGCPTLSAPSVYELFTATNPADVSGMDFTFIPNGVGGYLVITGIAGPFFNTLTTPLNAGDDTTHSIALPFSFPHGSANITNIYVSSNGFLTLGTVDPFSGCCSGSVSSLLAGESRISAWWSDLNPGPSGAGEVFADLDPGSGDFVVTWSGVPEYVNTGTNTFQIALNPSGMFKIRLQTVARATHDFLLGYSYGHGANTNAVDMSAIVATDIGALRIPLAIAAAAGSRPAIGTTFTMNVSGIAPTPQGNVVLLFIGFSELNPGVDLGAALGAPGCTAFFLPGPNDLNFLNFTFGAPTTSFAVGVPLNPALIGVVGIAEAVSDDTTANAFGWKFSNGLRLTVGI